MMNVTVVNDTTLTFIKHDGSTGLQPNEETIIILVLKILAYGITPAISVFGVVGNVLSIIILKRHGLHKCSNILLVSLAVSDCCFLISLNSVPRMLYDIEGNGRFLYSEGVSYFLYILYNFLNVFDYGMGVLAMTIPALITVERVIAVVFPLRVNTIVTPRRTWVAVFIFWMYCVGFAIYGCFWSKFEYSFDPKYNRTVGRKVLSALFFKDSEVRAYMDQIHLGFKIQPSVTLIGCILIIVKVKMASIKRRKLSGSRSSSNRSPVSKTTKMLMAVCVVYLFVCGLLDLPALLPANVLQFSLTSGEKTSLGLVMYQVLNTVLCLNSSWNFIIYIVFNKNFRDTYKEIVNKNCRSSSKNNTT